MEPIYAKLRDRLDMYSFGYPASPSGVELEILEHLFTPQEAATFLALSPKLETPAEIAPRLSLDSGTAERLLEDMAARGLLFRQRKGDEVKYGAIPFMHGLIEFRVKDVDPKLTALVKRYFDEAFNDRIAGNLDMFLRVIPVNMPVEMEQRHHVASYEDACGILRGMDVIAVADCICRKQEMIMGRGCGRPLEACFMFGSMARYYIENGIGRQVTVDEAIAIVRKCQEAGLVTQPSTSRNPAGMCNCCGDCCGVLGAIKKHPRPADLVFTNHYCVVDETLCTACGACVDRCPMDALTVDDIAAVDLSRCIGCGLCVISCPLEALSLARKENPRAVPADTREQMTLMARKRGLIP